MLGKSVKKCVRVALRMVAGKFQRNFKKIRNSMLRSHCVWWFHIGKLTKICTTKLKNHEFVKGIAQIMTFLQKSYLSFVVYLVYVFTCFHLGVYRAHLVATLPSLQAPPLMCCIVLCYAMLYLWLCYAMLCCIVFFLLCCMVLSFVVLCCFEFFGVV